ncbi:hypothetical protein [Mesorhizobium onobrychidis]|uniref:Uncharacterized protein n=1 Tax=Mesorhizobium onobrychidis TaxID=2775404 RepID=A0ABY5QS19_9HYPH|nr:hypothetical protein [Mesorhizobium onobrychidis]UVC12882.1 hypothetical protein IHQ72_19110 [Mesorhizobium onobrychidis]
MAIFKQNAKAAPLRFDLRQAEPAYAALAEKCANLRASISRLDAEESDLLGKLTSRTPKPSDGMNSRVAEMLGETVNETDPLVDGIQARLREVNALRHDTRAALAIVGSIKGGSDFAQGHIGLVGSNECVSQGADAC